MRNIKLTDLEVELLVETAANHHKSYVRKKSQMLLNSFRGSSVKSLCSNYLVNERNVYRLFNSWENEGLLGLLIKPGRGVKKRIDWEDENISKILKKAIENNPQSLKEVAEELTKELCKENEEPITKSMVKNALKKKVIHGKE